MPRRYLKRVLPQRHTVREQWLPRLATGDVLGGTGMSNTMKAFAGIEPADSSFLDPRSEQQARAAVRASESAEQAAKAQVEEAEAELEPERRQDALPELRDGCVCPLAQQMGRL